MEATGSSNHPRCFPLGAWNFGRVELRGLVVLHSSASRPSHEKSHRGFQLGTTPDSNWFKAQWPMSSSSIFLRMTWGFSPRCWWHCPKNQAGKIMWLKPVFWGSQFHLKLPSLHQSTVAAPVVWESRLVYTPGALKFNVEVDTNSSPKWLESLVPHCWIFIASRNAALWISTRPQCPSRIRSGVSWAELPLVMGPSDQNSAFPPPVEFHTTVGNLQCRLLQLRTNTFVGFHRNGNPRFFSNFKFYQHERETSGHCQVSSHGPWRSSGPCPLEIVYRKTMAVASVATK